MSTNQPQSPFYPSGLLDPRNATNIGQVMWQNFYVINESPGFSRSPSRVKGRPTDVPGPPTRGQNYANALWVDGLRSVWCCTATGNPGTWVQIEVPILSGSMPTVVTVGYRVIRSDLGYSTFVWNGTAWVNSSGGSITGASNLGTGSDGEGLFYDVSGGLIRLLRVKGSDNITVTTVANSVVIEVIDSPYFTGTTKVDALYFAPSSAPSTPTDGTFVIWTETTGTSPSKVITWKAKSEDGVEVILASTIV